MVGGSRRSYVRRGQTRAIIPGASGAGAAGGEPADRPCHRDRPRCADDARRADRGALIVHTLERMVRFDSRAARVAAISTAEVSERGIPMTDSAPRGSWLPRAFSHP